MKWSTAVASNFLVRNSRKDKVRLKLKPFCEAIPDDITSDLVVLQNLADLAPKAEEYGRVLGECTFWRGLDTDVTKIGALPDGQEKALGHVANLGAHTPDRDGRCARPRVQPAHVL